METGGSLTHCYVDDSIHEALGFVALGFVFSAGDLGPAVREALLSVGMKPDEEEFKSGTRMAENPVMRQAREALLSVIQSKTRVGVVVASRRNSSHESLGKQCLQALQSILVRNGIPPRDLKVHVDEGIFESEDEARTLQRLFRFLEPVVLVPRANSHHCHGVQVADLIAHTFAQVIREGVTGTPKMIDVGGPENGYAEGTLMPLSEFLLGGIRYAILARRMVYEGQDFDPATDPVIMGPEEDDIYYGQNPEALGWGVQVAPEVPGSVRQAVSHMLDRIWLGCMH